MKLFWLCENEERYASQYSTDLNQRMRKVEERMGKFKCSDSMKSN